jgi:hypothetical protein
MHTRALLYAGFLTVAVAVLLGAGRMRKAAEQAHESTIANR